MQCLQRLHGGRETWVRHGGTMLALSRLHDKDLLSDTEYSRLASAYQFLRAPEHRLQLYDDRQTHTLPRDPRNHAVLARKMPAAHIGAAPSAEACCSALNKHLEDVEEIYERVIHAQQPMYYTSAPPPSNEPASRLPQRRTRDGLTSRRATWSGSWTSARRNSPAALSRGNLRRGRVHFEHFLEQSCNIRTGWTG